jgi:choline dehydrogenase
MGKSPDAGAVVDSEGRVFGVNNLRIADASIFPQITNGNLNAPVIMVAERISDFVLQRDPLPAAKFDVGNDPWQPPSNNTNKEKVAINV